MSEPTPEQPAGRCPTSPEGGYHRFKLPPAAANVQACCVYCGVERTLAANARRPFWLRNRPARRRSTES